MLPGLRGHMEIAPSKAFVKKNLKRFYYGHFVVHRQWPLSEHIRLRQRRESPVFRPLDLVRLPDRSSGAMLCTLEDWSVLRLNHLPYAVRLGYKISCFKAHLSLKR